MTFQSRSVNPSIIFFGTPEFALPALEALIAKKYHIVGVVTNPDEPVGRKHILTPPPVKTFAQRHGIPVFQPEKLNIAQFAGCHADPPDGGEASRPPSRKRSFTGVQDDNSQKIPSADLFIVAAYGKIIPKAILEIPKYGTLNIHPSLLPRWRGASPIQSAILAGDADTGVTIMQLDELMDHGSIVAQETAHVGDRKVTYPQLHDELAQIGAQLLIKTIPDYISGAIVPIPQHDVSATYCAVLKKEDGRIDWHKSAEEIERMVRAYSPWPTVWTLWPAGDHALRIRIDEADITSEELPQGSPGLVWQKENALLVQTSKGSVVINRATLEGKNPLTGAELLHGYPQLVGSVLK